MNFLDMVFLWHPGPASGTLSFTIPSLPLLLSSPSGGSGGGSGCPCVFGGVSLRCLCPAPLSALSPLALLIVGAPVIPTALCWNCDGGGTCSCTWLDAEMSEQTLLLIPAVANDGGGGGGMSTFPMDMLCLCLCVRIRLRGVFTAVGDDGPVGGGMNGGGGDRLDEDEDEDDRELRILEVSLLTRSLTIATDGTGGGGPNFGGVSVSFVLELFGTRWPSSVKVPQTAQVCSFLSLIWLLLLLLLLFVWTSLGVPTVTVVASGGTNDDDDSDVIDDVVVDDDNEEDVEDDDEEEGEDDDDKLPEDANGDDV